MIYVILSVCVLLVVFLAYKWGQTKEKADRGEKNAENARKQADIANSPRLDFAAVLKRLQDDN